MYTVKKLQNFDSNMLFSIKTAIYHRKKNAFWVIFVIFEKVANRNIL